MHSWVLLHTLLYLHGNLIFNLIFFLTWQVKGVVGFHTQAFREGNVYINKFRSVYMVKKKKKRPRDNLVKEENDELFFYISTVLFSRLMVNYSCLGVNEINK